IRGTAVTAVKIEGALHEFQTLPEVGEDVSEIILNIKEIRLRSTNVEPVIASVEKDGPCDVTAGDIKLPAGVEVLNPELVIARLSDGGRLSAELRIETGRGYDRAETRSTVYDEVGWIPIDAVFTPIQKVAFQINLARVGASADYDRLSLQVWTDASVTPEDAVAYAAKILKEQMTVFIN